MEHQEKFLIALDIDGTLTTGNVKPALQVVEFLDRYPGELVFLTGRTFSFAKPILEDFKRSYLLVVQNGATTIQMPEAKLIRKKSFKKEQLRSIDHFPFLVETGFENRDICYFRPKDFSVEERKYIDFRNNLCPEEWREIDSFFSLPLSEFAIAKYFAEKKVAFEMKEKIDALSPLKATIISDPFRSGYYLGHVADPLATKGEALCEIARGKKVVAAGDDENDLGMLHYASVKIAMKKSPKTLLEIATVVSDPGPALIETLKRIL